MSAFRKVILGALLLLYAFALSSAVFRLIYQTRHRGRWHDDTLSGLSALAGLVLFLLLFYLLITEPLLEPVHYNVTLSIFFFILWNSRACLVMTTARVYSQQLGKEKYSRRFIWLSALLFTSGVAFSIATVIICSQAQECPRIRDCFCRLPNTLSIIALISGGAIELGLVTINVNMLSDFFSPLDTRTRIAAVGLFSNILTFALSTTFWVLYIVKTPKYLFLFLCLSNATVILSIIVSNVSVVIAAAIRQIFPARQGIPNPTIALNDYSDLDPTITPNEYPLTKFNP